MTWTRARDWLIGAAGTIVALVVAAVILWWVASDPSGGGAADPTPIPSQGAVVPAPGPAAADVPDGQVRFEDLRLDADTVLASGSTLQEVRAVGQDVLTGPDGLVAGRLTVDATVPFDVVAAELGGGSEVRAAADGQATVVRTVEALGRELRVTATGTVDVEAGHLVLEPRSVDVGGPDVLSGAIAAVVRRSMSLEHEIEGLPEGLVLREVVVRPDGFRATLDGEDVLLRR